MEPADPCSIFLSPGFEREREREREDFLYVLRAHFFVSYSKLCSDFDRLCSLGLHLWVSHTYVT